MFIVGNVGTDFISEIIPCYPLYDQISLVPYLGKMKQFLYVIIVHDFSHICAVKLLQKTQKCTLNVIIRSFVNENNVDGSLYVGMSVR